MQLDLETRSDVSDWRMPVVMALIRSFVLLDMYQKALRHILACDLKTSERA